MSSHHHSSGRRWLRVAVAVMVMVCAFVLLPSSVSGSMPGDNGEVLVYGHVGGERGLYLVDLEPLSLTKLPRGSRSGPLLCCLVADRKPPRVY